MRRTMVIVGVLILMTLTGPGAWADFSIVDGSGLEYFFASDTDTPETSNASGAATEASYTDGVSETLTDAFDGYNGLLINEVPYNNNGAATLSVSGHTATFNVQTIGGLQVYRKVYVPANDEFCRWLTVITNTGTGTELVDVEAVNDLGSDSGTLVESTSSGDAVATTDDTWVVTGGDEDDPPLGHVLRGVDATIGLDTIDFEDGDDEPSWSYTFGLAPGQTAIIMNFVTGQPDAADAADQAAYLAALGGHSVEGMSSTEKSQVLNFAVEGSLCPFGCTAMPVAAVGADLGATWGDLLLTGLAVCALMLAGRRYARPRARA